jgi:hypothetical protein
VLINSSFQNFLGFRAADFHPALSQAFANNESILDEEQPQNPPRLPFALEVDQGLTTSLTDSGSFLLPLAR